MANYLLIESRDPFGSNDTQFCCDLAKQLAQQGEAVTVFLVQNGVLPARAGARADELSALAKAGIEILADEFSLRERGIPTDRLTAGVKPAPLDVVIDRLADGCKAIWH
jgi:sulfur relay (sulfurtransferase) complex TusBCD TusD component (DsrE family)